MRGNPQSFLFKRGYGTPCSSLPRFTSSSQPSASVLVTALWWCREAESTYPSHSGLGIGTSYPLLVRQGFFCPCRSLKLSLGGWGQPRQLPWPIPQLFEVLDLLGCTQRQGTAAALCLSPVFHGHLPAWAWVKVGEEPRVPFVLQPLTSSCCLHCASDRDFSCWIYPPPLSTGQGCTCPSERVIQSTGSSCPLGCCQRTSFGKKDNCLTKQHIQHPGHESLGSPTLFPSAPDSIGKL